MADSKITALTALTSADPANDMIPIVDVSDTPPASGNTKRISINNILAASGTATLASATITGDLTVDTSTLKVDSALNKVGIGVATLTGLSTLNVAGDIAITSDLVLKNSGGTAQGYIFGSSGINYRVIAGQPHVWQEGGSDLMRLNSTGLGVGVTPSAGRGAIQLSAGVGFPATQVASSDANTLDDYEEGTFTPTVSGSTSAGTGTYSNQNGFYTKVGRLVTVTVYLNWTAHTGTGNLQFSNLPFTAANVAGNYNGISIGFVSNIALTAGNVLYGLVEYGTSYITATQTPTGGGGYSTVPIDTAGEIAFTATYYV